jgi:hypothetical protein
MTSQAWIQLVVYMALLAGLGWPLGKWMAAVAEGRFPRWMSPFVKIENALYRLAGVDPASSTGWKTYAIALIVFNVIGLVVVYALQRLQAFLPLNPQAMAAVSPDSSFNTAVSFITNTNWQGYGGESTMSYLTQTLALAVQMFLSAATGMAVVIALIRGFVARGPGKVKGGGGVGNFWVDMTRMTLYVLLPLSVVFAVFLTSQGVIQNFDAYKDATTLEVNAYQNPKNGPDGQPLKDAKGNPVTGGRQGDDAVAADGPGRLADRDQAARHQRRRLLQRELRASLRESDAARELPRAARDPADPGRAVLHVRRDGQGQAPGPGRVRGDDRHLPRGGLHDHAARAGRQSALRGAGRRPGAERDAVGRQHGRQGDALRHRLVDAVGARRPRPPTARSTRCTTPTRRSGGVPDADDPAGRGRLRRRRLGAVRHADLRHPGRLHRGPDDRPHARVPRQEDRAVRDEDDGDRDPRHAACSCWWAPPSR